ncbi:MAG: hypothetical protein KJ771_01760 [Nanoarchaeota archaeon]|nr:hypothetical protein [Nanoarchaeota archaeon]
MNPTIVVIIGIIVIFTIIYHVLKRIYFNQLVEQEKRAFHLIRKKRALWWLSPFYSNPLRKSKVKQMNRKRKHKIKQKQRDNFLTTVGLKPDQPTKTHFHHLKSIVHTHQKKTLTKLLLSTWNN